MTTLRQFNFVRTNKKIKILSGKKKYVDFVRTNKKNATVTTTTTTTTTTATTTTTTTRQHY